MVKIEGREAKGMRDTGATQSQVHKDLVPRSCYTGRSRIVRYANNAKDCLPLAIVHMETPYFSGNIEVLVAEDSPVPVLIGNIKEEVAKKCEEEPPATSQEEKQSAKNAEVEQPTEKSAEPTLAPIVPPDNKNTSATLDEQPSTSTGRTHTPLKVKQSAGKCYTRTSQRGAKTGSHSQNSLPTGY